MRISTNAILRNYGSNLNKSMGGLDDAREKVMTRRNFQRTAQDPAGATKAFQLRREYMKNEDHLENIKQSQARLDSVESGILQVSKMAEKVHSDTLIAINGSTGLEQRQAIAEGFRQMQESMVLSLNAKFGDRFTFGGANAIDVPLKLDRNTNVLTYHGIDVSDPAKLADLQALAGERHYIDTGFGLQVDQNGDVVEGTALDTSNPAISFIGFGKTADGTDKNLITVMGKLAQEFEKPELDHDAIKKLTDSFDISRNKVIDKITSIGTMSNFLTTTENRLIDNRLNLNEKIVSIENVDMEKAISNYEWAKFAYNAALKVGTSILQPSFIDFMK
ncbi:MAG: hypothetical protein Q4A75_05450 [Peptostreptococcaceae bacterium]|nr:hypothetical protein [Peptostreptococcaceae bacterium]